mmetsp:Transcript_22417/g.27604  ORF Transcript_22417/g.27604 Transcript_22417/m.27604 type:complete len:144 (-) Transcript_22417:650-1081(-)
MAENKSKEGGKKPKGNGTLIAFVVLGCICAPYFYYAMLINTYGQQNKPADYFLPGLSELWMTLVGAIVCTVARKAVFLVTYNTFYAISKEQNDEGTRKKYANKASDKLYRSIYFVCSSFWGWYVLKDTPYLPWYLGGLANGRY